MVIGEHVVVISGIYASTFGIVIDDKTYDDMVAVYIPAERRHENFDRSRLRFAQVFGFSLF